mgnify:CR=1 FL=1
MTDEWGQEGQSDLEGTTKTKGEEANVRIEATTSEGWNRMHTMRSLESQGTSMHSEELQQVTDDSGQVKPSRGKRGTKDGATRCQD